MTEPTTVPVTEAGPARQVVERYFSAINAHRFAELGEVFAPEAEIHTVGRAPALGRAEALAHFPTVLAGYAEHHDAVTRWIETEDAVVCEIHFTGRLRDGRPIVFDAVDLFDVRDGRIAKVSTWYDTRALARQIRG
ncbi:nuclear transport factor 2 family protein [Streptomyces sp. NPDC051985]|uniref:nuclear transport factor 2 family protein n=1 Tax=Streptomyces sp. NPDC051985 TaxID=3155807 RepID=UPI0034304657